MHKDLKNYNVVIRIDESKDMPFIRIYTSSKDLNKVIILQNEIENLIDKFRKEDVTWYYTQVLI